jgi:hypothetical protein
MISIAMLIKSYLIIVVATALCRRAGSENPEAPRHSEAATAEWREQSRYLPQALMIGNSRDN